METGTIVTEQLDDTLITVIKEDDRFIVVQEIKGYEPMIDVYDIKPNTLSEEPAF